MSKVNWVMRRNLHPEKDYFAVATDGLKIPIWNFRGFLQMTRYTNANVEQMGTYDTLVGYALNTQFGLMTNSRTLSVWEDMKSIRDYTNNGAHLESMIELGKIPSLRVKHAIWKFSGQDEMPTWEDSYTHIYRSKS